MGFKPLQPPPKDSGEGGDTASQYTLWQVLEVKVMECVRRKSILKCVNCSMCVMAGNCLESENTVSGPFWVACMEGGWTTHVCVII